MFMKTRTQPMSKTLNGTANSTYYDEHLAVKAGTGGGGGGILLLFLIGLFIYCTYPKWSCCKPPRPWRDLKKKELAEWELQQQREKFEKETENVENGEDEDFLKLVKNDEDCNWTTCMIDGKKISWIDLSYMERKHRKEEKAWRGGGPGVARKMSSDRRHSTPIKANINHNQDANSLPPLSKGINRQYNRPSFSDQGYLDINPFRKKKTSMPGSVVLDVSTNSLDDFSSCYDSMSRCNSIRSGNLWSALNGDPASGCTSFASFESFDVFEDALDYSSDYDNHSVRSTPVTSV
ncbi:uncharacterized protein LOC135493298 [Lineus longissimus]|uniref:uncharacterized protein LOC135493298 n=1 Tax=Lineus longissimus TaxID=88925 RepID=UPI002B4E70D4